jgi:hypothetical protein
VNHEEDKLLGLRYDLPAFLGRDQGNGSRWDYFRYPVQFPIQSNNNTMRLRLIYSMMFPEIRLAQKNITNFKGGDVTQYLIFEGLDAIGQATLLADVEISPLAEPSDGVQIWVWCCQQSQPLDNLC